MSDPSPSNSPELTVGALREWLNGQHRANSKDRDYSAAIVRDREALTRIMEHYDFCYGNAIVPQVAAEFVRAYCSSY